jgi:molybdopterin molybdotransferase
MKGASEVKVGLLGTVPFLGLPGNPNATLVTFKQIALPAIRTVAGLAQVAPSWFGAVSGFAYEKRLGRTEFVPVRIDRRDELGRPVLAMLGRGSSASLMAMAEADGIALLPPEVGSISAGLPVVFEPFSF